MKFKLITQFDGPVLCYGQEARTGDIIELDGHLADKALTNPNYERVKPGPKRGKQSTD